MFKDLKQEKNIMKNLIYRDQLLSIAKKDTHNLDKLRLAKLPLFFNFTFMKEIYTTDPDKFKLYDEKPIKPSKEEVELKHEKKKNQLLMLLYQMYSLARLDNFLPPN